VTCLGGWVVAVLGTARVGVPDRPLTQPATVPAISRLTAIRVAVAADISIEYYAG
jgi:hypothetical protein